MQRENSHQVKELTVQVDYTISGFSTAWVSLIADHYIFSNCGYFGSKVQKYSDLTTQAVTEMHFCCTNMVILPLNLFIGENCI